MVHVRIVLIPSRRMILSARLQHGYRIRRREPAEATRRQKDAATLTGRLIRAQSTAIVLKALTGAALPPSMVGEHPE